MNINQLVQASEILENLEQIEHQIFYGNKSLSADGKIRIDEIIKDCCDALSKTCACGDKGRKEFERINTLILDACLRIKSKIDQSNLSEIMA